MEFLIFLLVLGFAVYWLFRHPIKTFKFVSATIGLMILGVLGLGVAIFGLLWICNLL